MKKHEQFLSVSQLPPELNRDEMTAFLYRLPHLPIPVTSPSIWTSWRNWLFIAVCSTGLLFTIGRQPPGESSTLSSVDVAAKPGRVEEVNTQTIAQPEKGYLTEVIDAPAPAGLSPAPIKEEVVLAAVIPESDSLFPPAQREELFEPRKAVTTKKSVIHPVIRFKQGVGVINPIDTGKVRGLFGDYTPNPNPGLFDGVRIKRLRRQLRREFLRDGLITSKTEPADLWLPEGAAYLNGEELMPDLDLKYKKLAHSFGIKTGPDRYIKTTDKGIALGDFRKEGFFGRGWGVFKLEMTE